MLTKNYVSDVTFSPNALLSYLKFDAHLNRAPTVFKATKKYLITYSKYQKNGESFSQIVLKIKLSRFWLET